MGVGNAHQFQQALHRAVFAEAAMQGIEHRIGLGLEQLLAGIVAGIDAHRLEAFLAPAPSSRRGPEDSETSRSAERPPISTAMRL